MTMFGCSGINSFKVFQAYKDVFMIDDGEMLEVFRKTKELRALAQVHAENGHVIEQVCVLLKHCCIFCQLCYPR